MVPLADVLVIGDCTLLSALLCGPSPCWTPCTIALLILTGQLRNREVGNWAGGSVMGQCVLGACGD